MNFTPNSGINVMGDIIPAELRGVILPSTEQHSEKRRALAQKCPRMMGKQDIK